MLNVFIVVLEITGEADKIRHIAPVLWNLFMNPSEAFPCTLFSKHDGAVSLAIAKQGAGSENCSKECISVGKYSQQDQKVNNGLEV